MHGAWTYDLQIVGIPIRTICILLVADLVLLRFEREYIASLSNEYQAKIIDG